MSEWKNERAESEMRKHEAEMMKKLNTNNYESETLEKSWTINVVAIGEDAEKLIEEFEVKLLELGENLKKDTLPNLINVTVWPETIEDDEIQ